MGMPDTHLAQLMFNKTYISGAEIVKEVGVTRPALLYARRRGLLPDPIVVSPSVHLWIRADVKPSIEQWKAELTAKRGPSA